MGSEKKLAIITGASSGIGAATAWALARTGFDLILTARRAGRLKELQKDIESETKVKVEVDVFDVRNPKSCEQFVEHRVSHFPRLAVLVNNAGLAKGTEKFQDASIEDFELMIDTNVKGLIYMTRLVVPHMIANGRGHIVNLGSVAGRWVYPRGSVYCSTKFAVAALTEGLRMDLNGTPIRVTNIEPGMVDTEFSLVRTGSREKADAVYANMKPLVAEDVADSIAWCVSRPPHVNIQELVIYPVDQASTQLVHRQERART